MNDTAERWLPVLGYEGKYDVSDQGRVRSWLPWRGDQGPRILRPGMSSNGYLSVSLRGGEPLGCHVHALVLRMFAGPMPDGTERRHLDGNRTNNAASNLAYGTKAENMQDSLRQGTNRSARKADCKRGHPFDENNTYPSKDGRRQCRTCHIARTRAAREARAA